MKILKLNFKNIHSLQGEWEIDFTKSSFEEAGLFSIIGETGAGKSTILDAITLALYARLCRQDNEVSKNATVGKNVGENIMSKGTDTCFAEVAFEAKGKKYLSRWDLAKTRNGNLKDSEVFFQNLTDDIQSKDKKLFQENIAKASGLEYEQFLRSVMLAQGDFTKFLKSAKDERAKLLEKITGNDIYTNLSKAAHEKSKIEKNELTRIENTLQNIQVLEEKAIKGLVDEKEKKEEDLKNLKENLERLQNQKNWILEENKLKNKAQELQKDLANINQKKQIHSADYQKLEIHEKTIPFHNDLNEIDNLTKDLESTEKNKKVLSNKIQSLEKEQKQSEKNIKKLKITLLQIDWSVKDLIKKINAWFEKNKVYENLNIENLSSEFQTLQKDRRVLEKKQQERKDYLKKVQFYWLKDFDKSLTHENLQETIFQEKLKENQDNITTQKNEQNQNESLLKEVLGEKKLEDLENEKELKQKLILGIEKQIEFSEQTFNISENLQKNIERVEKIKKEEIPKIEENKKQLEERIKDKESLINNLEEKIKFQNSVKSQEKTRKDLKPNEPCPVCGSTEHPFVKGYEYTLDKDEKEKKEVEQERGKIQNEIKDFEKQIASLETEVKGKEELIVKNTKEKEEKIRAFEKINQDFKLKNQITEIRQIENSKNNEIQGLEKLKKQIKDIQNLSAKIQKNKDNIQTFQKQKNELESYESKLKNELEILAILQERRTKIEKVLEKYQEKIPESNEKVEKELVEKLEKLKKNWDRLKKEELKLNNISASLKNQIESLELAFEKEQIFSKGTKTESIVQKIESIRKNITEKNTKFTVLQNQITLQKGQLTQLETNFKSIQENKNRKENILLKEAQEADFHDIEDLRKSKLTENEKTNLEKLKNDIEEEIKKIEQFIEENKKQQTTHQKATHKTELSIEAVEQELKISQEHQKKFNQRIGEIKNQLQKNEEQKQYFQESQKLFKEQEKTYEKWKKLANIIGSSDGKKFREYAQGLTFRRLIENANIHLQELTARYSLVGVGDLGLAIIDKEQANSQRSTNSLSGGESFLVSLALALGLSDLSSQHTKIESLFIDEGFGTLDANTLQIALDALKKLQIKGKMIGVISHIDLLKENISTQIEVKKLGGGVSEIILPKGE